MKISKKTLIKEQMKKIEEEENLKKLEELRLEDQRRIKEMTKKVDDLEHEFQLAVQKDEDENKMRDEISPKQCLDIVKNAIDELSVLPRMKVLEALKTDQELIKDVDELKEQAQVIFKHVHPENNIRKSVVSMFKISLGIDLELEYIPLPDNKKVKFSDKVDEIDPEREDLLNKLKNKGKK